MRIAYFDCFSGASGDMILGALLAAGLDADVLRADLAKLNLDAYEIDIRPIRKQGFAAVKIDVRTAADQPHRHLSDICSIIDAADLPAAIRRRARAIFARLAEAEAKVHGVTVEEVHFHEVGAVDAIVDVVGAAIGIERLGIDRVECSPIPTGSGTVRCEHGVMPVPAPATAELLTGVPLAASEETGELITPTGAAILTTLTEEYGPLAPIRIERIGYGAGSREGARVPNLLRLIIGSSTEPEGVSCDQVRLLEANLDDTTGEEIGYAFERLLDAGALDVFTTPILMKKNRPGILLSVLTTPELCDRCEEIIFAETSTLGIRRDWRTRSKLERRVEPVATPFGEIRVKVALRDGAVFRIAPEYDDCAAAARARGVSLREVMDAARSSWSARHEAGK
ncbi:MAG: nickel pincer cofactor biosynthesis protein LarC [Phycisphaerae bacterium]